MVQDRGALPKEEGDIVRKGRRKGTSKDKPREVLAIRFVRFCNGLKGCWHVSCSFVLACFAVPMALQRGRCLFRHRDADAGVTPPMTRTEEEVGPELAALWKAVSKLAATLMLRTEQNVDVPVPQVVEEEVVGEVVVELAAPPLQQSPSLLLKFGLLELQRTVPRKNQYAQCLPGWNLCGQYG